jgi:hypothetical protein
MAKADTELRFKCLELAMRANTYKLESGLTMAARFVEFVEQETAGKKSGTTPKRASKTVGKTTAGGPKAQE